MKFTLCNFDINLIRIFRYFKLCAFCGKLFKFHTACEYFNIFFFHRFIKHRKISFIHIFFR